MTALHERQALRRPNADAVSAITIHAVAKTTNEITIRRIVSTPLSKGWSEPILAQGGLSPATIIIRADAQRNSSRFLLRLIGVIFRPEVRFGLCLHHKNAK